MYRVTPRRIAAVGTTIAVAAFLFYSTTTPTEPPPPGPSAVDDQAAPTASLHKRVYEMIAMAPDVAYDDAVAMAQATDRLRERADDSSPETPSEALRTRLRTMKVPEAEIVAYYESHPDVFGARTFAQSRRAAEMLVRIERLQGQLGLSD